MQLRYQFAAAGVEQESFLIVVRTGVGDQELVGLHISGTRRLADDVVEYNAPVFAIVKKFFRHNALLADVLTSFDSPEGQT